MHGIGNDYIFVNCLNREPENPNELAKFLCNRHFSIGGDGLILILPSYSANVQMRIFNSDGSEAELCGNAIRCLGKYIYDEGLIKNPTVTVETLAGIKTLQINLSESIVKSVSVNMGVPILIPDLIPVISNDHMPVIDREIKVDENTILYSAVSMGNPHAVVFVYELDTLPIEKIGSLIEVHSDFPERTNVEFVQVLDSGTLKVRVWERGVGETLGCGTGACAVAVISDIKGLIKNECIINMRGGILKVQVGSTVYLTGNAVYTFSGNINLPKEFKFIKTKKEM